jgi:hypothetical protein
MNYLEQAKQKRKASQTVDYKMKLVDFICCCYVYLTPASYGYQLQHYICHILLKLKKLGDNLGLGDFVLNKEFGEFKSTYLSKDNEYNLTHLRQWQNFSYYLLCFIDCDNDFNPEFYLITKEDMGKFKLGFMNGIAEENKGQKNREKRLTVKKGSKNHKLFAEYNILSGTSFKDLKSYVKSK